MVIVEIGIQNPLQVDLVQHDQVVEAFPANRSDDPLDVRILPGRLGRDRDFVDAQPLDAFAEVVAVDAVAVSDHVSRGFVEGEGLDDLLSRPPGRGIRGDVEVDHAATIVAEDDKAVEHAERGRRHGEEVDGDQVGDMVLQKRPPSLRGRFAGAVSWSSDSCAE